MIVTPTLHAGLLATATILALLFAGLILARNPQSTPARMHAIYGGLAALWFFCMAMIAGSDTRQAVEFWARAVQIAIGMLPGVILHLNAATAGVAHARRRQIRWHYGLSIGVTTLCLVNPYLLGAVQEFSWGPYPKYTLWGAIPLVLLAVTFAEVIYMYRREIKAASKDSAHRQKLQAFYHGNMLASLALLDFAPAFGVGLYPFGFVLMSCLHIATVFGTIRYRLIELTREFAANEILETMADGLLVLDTEQRIRQINPPAAALLGSSAQTLINTNLDQCAPQALLDFLDATPHSSAAEVTTNGLTLAVSTSALTDQADEPIGLVVVLHDLTAQRVAEAAKDELEGWVRTSHRLETLGVMAGGIAHDFNNILAAILGSADIARHHSVSREEVDEALDLVIGAAERAAELTAQMLTYAGQADTRERPIDINVLCKEVSGLLHTAVAKTATCEFHFAQGLPLVLGDSGQLTQVILNLMTNASDALGGRVGRVTLRTSVIEMERDDGSGTEPHVTVEVSDTGAGMDPEVTQRIFDPFFSTRFAGRGLGLANVLGIVKAHHGRIKVDSKPGQGSTFTIALPASAQARVAPAERAEEQPSTESGTVLLVDDEPEVRRVANKMLGRLGFDVIEASHGKEAEAIFRLRQNEISLVVLDVIMPEMDGFEAYRIVRALSPSVPIILMSGNPVSDPYAMEGRPHFLMKPFTYQQLSDAVHHRHASP